MGSLEVLLPISIIEPNVSRFLSLECSTSQIQVPMTWICIVELAQLLLDHGPDLWLEPISLP